MAAPIVVTMEQWMRAVQRRLDSLEARRTGPMDTDWVDLTLEGDWVASGGRVPQVRRWGIFVILRGAVSGGTGTVAVLPEGFRPSTQTPTLPVANTSAAYVSVNGAGVLTITGGNSPWSLCTQFPLG